MFEFSITEILNNLEGLSIGEKQEALDSLYEELDDAAQNVLNAKDDLAVEYEKQVGQTLEDSIIHLRTDQHLEDVLQIIKETYSTSYQVLSDGNTYHICFGQYYGEWTMSVYVGYELSVIDEYNLLRKFAKHCNIPFSYHRRGRCIAFFVEESELFEQVKSIVLKVKNRAFQSANKAIKDNVWCKLEDKGCCGGKL